MARPVPCSKEQCRRLSGNAEIVWRVNLRVGQYASLFLISEHRRHKEPLETSRSWLVSHITGRE